VESDCHERTTAHQTHGDVRANEAERLKTEAKKLPQGKEREDMMRKARQAETASQISARLFSSGTAEANLIAQPRSPVSKGMPEITARDLI
jgi:hypothetical protein